MNKSKMETLKEKQDNFYFNKQCLSDVKRLRKKSRKRNQRKLA